MLVAPVLGFDDWRTTARSLLAQHVRPADVLWTEAGDPQSTLLDVTPPANPAATKAAPVEPAARVPREFIRLAQLVACHRDTQRWNRLYRVLWRIAGGERELLNVSVDPDVYELTRLEKAVRRDAHKMQAFVRFQRQDVDGREEYLAWYKPDHRIVELVAPFFVRRFRPMSWTIVTPDASAAWDGHALRFGPGMPVTAAPALDELVGLWRTYYAATFNPARTNVATMVREMPRRFWDLLPETELIDDLLADAPGRTERLLADQPQMHVSAADFLPHERSLEALRSAATCCQGCELHARATQTVFGRGPADARIVFVGEQPGDSEDIAGAPFVGPAGRVFDEALAQAGIDRGAVYVTNAVKHFKWTERGTRRLHAKPSAREVTACRPWLEAELHAVRPAQLVCLGATAAQSLLGPAFRITRDRGRVFRSEWADWTMATYHPSAVLRALDSTTGERIRADFVSDLRKAAAQAS